MRVDNLPVFVFTFVVLVMKRENYENYVSQFVISLILAICILQPRSVPSRSQRSVLCYFRNI